MKIIQQGLRLGYLVLLLVVFATHVQARTWTRKDGKTAEGELIAVTGSTATIALSDNNEATLMIAELSPDDQQFIKDWIPKRPLNVPEAAVYHQGSWYLCVLDSMSWKLAVQKAEKMGGHLAWVDSEQTQAFITKVARGVRVWLGATDEKSEGLWKWTNDEKMAFSDWDEQQPNNFKRRQHYLATSPNGKWNDEYESDQRVAGFIVQWD